MHNPVFPIEWRDEAYRAILPDDLRRYYDKWRGYIEEVRGGSWEKYLHDLYLFDRLSDEHQVQQFEDLVDSARASLTRTNAWCRKEALAPIRERILQFNAFERLKTMRDTTPLPRFEGVSRAETVTTEQQQKKEAYGELRQAAATQIREWNSLVPGKSKVQFPSKTSYSDFLARANCTWLGSFMAWCGELLRQGCGLFLWS